MPETNQPANEPPTTYQEQMALLRGRTGSLKLFGYYALLHFLVMLIVGFVFTFMLMPLMLAFVLLASIFAPAYHLLGRMLGVKGLPVRLAKPPAGRVIWTWVWVLFQLGLIAILFRFVFLLGFCNQNAICIAGRLLLK